MPKKKEDIEVLESVQKTGDQAADLRAAMIQVGEKLCRDLMDGKARDEKTALTAIVDIYEAVNSSNI